MTWQGFYMSTLKNRLLLRNKAGNRPLMKVICSLLLFAPCLSALMISCCEYFLITVKLTDYRLSPIAVEDSLFRYLRLFLLSKYVNAAKMTNSSVSISSVFIPTSFPFPERTTADYPYLL